jgi:hypothetical protein
MKGLFINILLIIIGILLIWCVSKNKPSKTGFERANNFQGIGAGVGFIMLGVIGLLEYYKIW